MDQAPRRVGLVSVVSGLEGTPEDQGLGPTPLRRTPSTAS